MAVLLPVVAACSNDDDEVRIFAAGHVEATQVRLATKIGGTLEWFPLEEGDRVDDGDEIARIETVDLELALAAARAERDLAAADLSLKQAGYRREEIGAARARAAALKTELTAAERELARFQGLLDSGSGIEKSRDDALTRRDRATQELQVAEEQLRQLEAGFRDEEIAAARARMAAAEARIAQIEQQIRDATLRSPTSGVVTEKLVEPGELLPAGTALALVTDLQDAWLTAYVPETDLGRLRLGQQAEIVTDDGERRSGTLSFINERAEFTPKNVQTRDERVKLVYRVKIRLDNDDGFFKPGMPAEAWLEPAGGGSPGEGARETS
jgi:HlyD family secretion protein